MLILIAESKTMTPCSTSGLDDYCSHRPVFADKADAIMESLRGATAEEIAADAKFSLPLAGKLLTMVYEFPNKSVGAEAINAFTGVVFKAFDYPTLGNEAKAQTCARVRLISSLYGWLRPDDIIKPYRLDFTTPLAPGGLKFSAYWRDAVTSRLLEELREGKHRDIVNLLPGDAARCIDWQQIATEARVWKAEFQEVQPGGKAKTPNSNRLKTLRGRLLRQIVTEGVTSPDRLMTLESANYAGCGTADADGNIIYHTVAD